MKNTENMIVKLYFYLIRNYYLLFKRDKILKIFFNNNNKFIPGDTAVYDNRYYYLFCVGKDYFIIRKRPR